MAAGALPLEPVDFARSRWPITAAAASVALVVGAAVATAALYGRAPRGREAALLVSPHQVQPVHDSTLDSPSPSQTVDPQDTFAVKPQRAARTTSIQESYSAELKLLEQAHAAYAGRNFSAALSLLAEHRRRFPNGRLAEECEALHVKTLARAGREKEARRAAAAFAERFPRSVLLPRLGEATP
jgi:hypothetical protein